MGLNRECEVLCVGASSYDISFSVAQHPEPDSKSVAQAGTLCGGGPAANAAYALRGLGHTSAFLGYLGEDCFGDAHLAELEAAGVNTEFVVRGQQGTPLSVTLAKPNGDSSLVNYTPQLPSITLPAEALDVLRPKLILFDGRHPRCAQDLLSGAKARGINTMLDAGSLHEGSERLASQVDYLICSRKFSIEYCNTNDEETALAEIAELAPYVVITLGEKGLVWKTQSAEGRLGAFKVAAIDGVGAGDAFHAALCAAIIRQMDWQKSLEFASAAGALTASRLGARTAFPNLSQIEHFLANTPAAEQASIDDLDCSTVF